MASTVNIHAAKTNLSQLVEKVSTGEDIIICKAGKPVAKLVPFKKAQPVRKFGLLKGRIKIAKDFDSPLPENILSEFEK